MYCIAIMTRLEGRHGALTNDDDRAPGPLIGHVEGHLRVAKVASSAPARPTSELLVTVHS